MAIILSLYASVLALAVWQEEHASEETECGKKGC
jgi:hypothetical protein